MDGVAILHWSHVSSTIWIISGIGQSGAISRFLCLPFLAVFATKAQEAYEVDFIHFVSHPPVPLTVSHCLHRVPLHISDYTWIKSSHGGVRVYLLRSVSPLSCWGQDRLIGLCPTQGSAPGVFPGRRFSSGSSGSC